MTLTISNNHDILNPSIEEGGFCMSETIALDGLKGLNRSFSMRLSGAILLEDHMPILKKCKVCGKEILTYQSEINMGRDQYCSIKCRNSDPIYLEKSNRLSYEGRLKSNKFHNQIGKRKENCVLWKGGTWIDKAGYRVIYYKDKHPYRKGRTILEHRKVMEDYLGRYLNTNEEVHHRNGIKDDNRIENLEIRIKKLHYGEVCCPYCNKKFQVK